MTAFRPPGLVTLDTAAEADFAATLQSHGIGPLISEAVTTLQINIGRRCNQACHHCHVEAGPKRTETISARVADRVLELLRKSDAITTVDITGGAPELNREFRRLVTAAREHGCSVIDRCNLTILFEPGQENLAEFLAHNRVHIVASLPCYSSDNVDKQRGNGVFQKSIRALQLLNQLGYGRPDSDLQIDLVYNPIGPSLPPDQSGLERDYKRRLLADFGIEFNQLFTITNVPIRRFAHALKRDGQWDTYQSLLVNHFNASTVLGLMCRSQVSVSYDGALYDCDFNQMLEMSAELPRRHPAGAPPAARPGARPTIWDIDSFADLDQRNIATASHCFACTAGAGSSCGGALTE